MISSDTEQASAPTATVGALSVSEPQLIAVLCRRSFAAFVRTFWPEIIKEPLVWNWHMDVLCLELQRVAERVMAGRPNDYDLLANVPPGTSKSTIVSEMFPAWVWTKWPWAQFICGSYAHLLGLDLSKKSRDIVQSAKYQQAFGIELREDQNTKGLFQNQHGGWRLSCTPTSTATGFHAHFILVDDPLNPKEAASEAKLKEANEWMKDTLPSRKVNKATACTILIMQRLHQNDPSAQMLALGKDPNATPIRHICLPARLSANVSPAKLRARYSAEGLLDPIRLPERVLRNMEAQLGQYGAAGQLMQNPVPAEGGMFKVVLLQFKPRPVRYRRIVRYWDKAGSAGKGCYTVGVLMIEDGDGAFGILDVVRGQWDSSTREKMIRMTAEMDGHSVPVLIEQEGGSGGKESAENTIRKTLVGFRVYADKPVGDKALRADPFSVQVNAGNVWVLQNAHWAKDYIDELQFFPVSTYMDQVDASSGAFNYLAKFRGRVGAF